MTITLTREEVQQVLDCLAFSSINLADEMTKTLRERLAQPEPEPVAWLYRGDGMVQVLIKRNDHFFSLDEGENFIKGDPLYTAPSQREWQGLTMDELDELVKAYGDNKFTLGMVGHVFAIDVEAKLKEKNS
jgi:hypothetical protein